MNKKWMNKRYIRIVSRILAVVFLFQITACGTLLYPERRGQKTGRIDAGVAVLNGIGLLFFVVPGIVAFAVDFATGAIFLPPGQSNTKVFGARDFPVAYADRNNLNRAYIEQIVLEQTGKKVDLGSPDLVVVHLKNKDEIFKQYGRWFPSVVKRPNESDASIALKRN